MHEIRIHGRGGQGAVVGSEVLAQACFYADQYVQAFPQFGVERRGAPVTAFCRIDDAPILLRNQIVAPDTVIVLDASLLHTVDVTAGLKPHGTILINAGQKTDVAAVIDADRYRVAVVDAATIAVRHHLGDRSNPIVNTAILGAFARIESIVGIDAIEKAIAAHVPLRKEENQQAARSAFEQVRWRSG